MPFVHGRSTGVLINATDFTAYLNESSASGEIDATETTTFGQGSKTYLVGLADGKVSFSGLFDGGTNAQDQLTATMRANAISTGVDVVTTYAPEGNVFGKRCTIAQGVLTSYEISGAVADVNEAKYEVQTDGGLDSGLILAAATSVSTATTTNGTAIDNAASSASGATAVLHVTANANAGATTFKVQHSVDNSVWVDLITFTSVTASTTSFQRGIAAGTVNRYLRAQATTAGAGNITYTIAAARR